MTFPIESAAMSHSVYVSADKAKDISPNGARCLGESAASCPKCGKAWLLETSGSLAQVPGVVIAVHPPGPCIPLPAVPRERQPVGDPALCAYEGCRREFVKHSNAQRYCSGKCCEKGCKHSGNRARLRRYWQRIEKAA